MTASAAGSGGAVCPSTASGGAVIFFVYGCAVCWVWVLLCPSTSAAGAVTVGAATAMPAGAGGPPAPATVPGVPGVAWCAWHAWCAWRAWSYALSGDFPL